LAPKKITVTSLKSASPAQSALFALLSRAETVAAARSDQAAALIVTLAFLTGCWLAANRFLNGDEAMNALWANMFSWRETLRYGYVPEHVHPPLYILSLHFWRLIFGNSEFSLRFPSLICAAGYLWFFYKWVKLRLNASAALAALLILAFSPAVMALAVEIRTYALMLFLMAAALYALEIAAARNSMRLLVLHSLLLALSLLNSYSSVWFIVPVQLYALIRFLRRHLPLRMGYAWAALQLLPAALAPVLYVTHLRAARAGGFGDAANTWLKASFMQPAQSALAFAWKSTLSLFEYLFHHKEAAPAAVFLFLAGFAVLLFQNFHRRGPESPVVGWMLILPAGLASLASIAGVAPYGGSRHSIVPATFLIAGAAYALSRIMNRRVLPVLVLGALLTPFWPANGYRNAWYFPGPNFDKAALDSVLKDMRLRIPAGGHLFMDRQSCLILKYYLGKDHSDPLYVWNATYPIQLGGYNVSCYMDIWSLTGEQFPKAIAQTRSRFGIESSTPVWVFDAGWGVNVAEDLLRGRGDLPVDLQWHGRAVSLFRYAGR
jgi:hypothetical protein